MGDVKYVGLTMIANEDDVLAEVVAHHESLVDVFYVLDGTVPNAYSKQTVTASEKCAGYTRDAELPRPPYPVGTVCGYRKFLHEQAVAEFGPDNVFVLLHGDEVWTATPRRVVQENPSADGFVFLLPFYFPRESWDITRSPLEQLKWRLGPGFPEFRMFVGREGMAYSPTQHFDVAPSGVRYKITVSYPIRHYLFRSPEAQRTRARMHAASGYDPSNYEHILNGDRVIWTEEMIGEWQRNPHFRELVRDD
jgi:hypothetical protein